LRVHQIGEIYCEEGGDLPRCDEGRDREGGQGEGEGEKGRGMGVCERKGEVYVFFVRVGGVWHARVCVRTRLCLYVHVHPWGHVCMYLCVPACLLRRCLAQCPTMCRTGMC
jgi:hypothetical protein